MISFWGKWLRFKTRKKEKNLRLFHDPFLNRLNHSKTCLRDKNSFKYTSFNITISFGGSCHQFHKRPAVNPLLHLTTLHFSVSLSQRLLRTISIDKLSDPQASLVSRGWGKHYTPDTIMFKHVLTCGRTLAVCQ